MPKNKQASGLGRQIIKDRFGKKNRPVGDSFLHTSDLKDGYEWGRLNLQSVTEQNNLEEFLSTAELAGTEFTAEKLNVKFVTSDNYGGIPQGEDLKKIHGLHKEHQKTLRIPRRPAWHKQMSASQLDQLEREAFLEWRRSLASLQEVEGLVMTPYEKNLDFWRQLWRVIERSDIVVQIVDARNPLLFYCPDLEQYVQEVDMKKVCLLLINKADFLTQTQRDMWAAHFAKKGVKIAFWSALEEACRQEKMDETEQQDTKMDPDDSDDDSDEEENMAEFEKRLKTDSDDEDGMKDDDNDEEFVDKYGNKINRPKASESFVPESESDSSKADSVKSNNLNIKESAVNKSASDKMMTAGDVSNSQEDKLADKMDQGLCDIVEKSDSEIQGKSSDNKNQSTEGTESNLQDRCSGCTSEMRVTAENEFSSSQINSVQETVMDDNSSKQNSGKIYHGEELLDLFRSLHTGTKVQKIVTTVGMVGYPNVGKSSTINAILRMKKVPVSATPGRTKHFQTLFVDPELMLCDCPGLVFPSFVTTKADLVVSGILPVDQMRDHIPPTSLVCQLIPRQTLERTYGIIIPPPGEAEDPNRPPTSHEFLNAYGAMRGFMTARGVPDCPRSSRYILKDYVNGKLLYCHPPPDADPVTFNPVQTDSDLGVGVMKKQASGEGTEVVVPSQVDKDFFRKSNSTVHSRTARTGGVDTASSLSPHSSQSSLTGKPWKRHNNRKKKEKMRRVYGHLDD